MTRTSLPRRVAREAADTAWCCLPELAATVIAAAAWLATGLAPLGVLAALGLLAAVVQDGTRRLRNHLAATTTTTTAEVEAAETAEVGEVRA